MNVRFFFPLALLASLAMHGGLFLSMPGSHSSAAAAAPKQAPKITRVVFRQVVKQQPDEPSKEIKPVEKRKLKETLPTLAKKKLKPQFIEVKKKPTTAQAEIIPQAVEIAATKAAKIPDVIPRDLMADIRFEKEKQRYMNTLLAHIESHKFYPRSARKRGIQGHVNVSFSLSPSGNISTINVKGGSTILQRAACNAVNASLPLPKPPESLEEALPVTYRMAFLLN